MPLKTKRTPQIHQHGGKARSPRRRKGAKPRLKGQEWMEAHSRSLPGLAELERLSKPGGRLVLPHRVL